MPTFDLYGYKMEYATEEEVLEFANKLRALGGANALDALMPSVQSSPSACLIANALNFGCSVAPDRETLSTTEYTWNMYFPSDFSEQKINEIGEALGCKVGSREYKAYDWDTDEEITETEYYLVLPRLIGNAAHAFDSAEEGWVIKYRSATVRY